MFLRSSRILQSRVIPNSTLQGSVANGCYSFFGVWTLGLELYVGCRILSAPSMLLTLLTHSLCKTEDHDTFFLITSSLIRGIYWTLGQRCLTRVYSFFFCPYICPYIHTPGTEPYLLARRQIHWAFPFGTHSVAFKIRRTGFPHQGDETTLEKFSSLQNRPVYTYPYLFPSSFTGTAEIRSTRETKKPPQHSASFQIRKTREHPRQNFVLKPFRLQASLKLSYRQLPKHWSIVIVLAVRRLANSKLALLFLFPRIHMNSHTDGAPVDVRVRTQVCTFSIWRLLCARVPRHLLSRNKVTRTR